ncbi:MAG: beta-lactamase family protein [Clostridia bacterium]|nr:beta-lactamase family protein [Clostridia bacterium]
MEKDILKIGSPAKAGVRYQDIHAFLDALEENRLMLHGFVLTKDDAVFAEGYFAPFTADFMHRMYSSSKTFTAMAIGALAAEGKISLDDPVYKYFPDKLPEKLDPLIAQCTIRHLLIMATPFNRVTYGPYVWDWCHSFFNTPADHAPGTVYIYDTCGSYMMDAIVERVTGKPFMEYLLDVGLRDIGFSEDTWCVQSPDGYSWGGSGTICTCRDLCRLASLMKNGGEFDGKQILPRDFIKEATKKQIDKSPKDFDAIHSLGYGYQTHIALDGFALLGMGSQCAWVSTEKNVVAAFTGDTQGDGLKAYLMFDLFKQHIYDNIGEPYEEDPVQLQKLCDRLAKLRVPVPKGETSSAVAEQINGKTYSLSLNPMGILSVRFTFEGDCGTLYYDTVRGAKKLPFGMGHFIRTTFPETHYQDEKIQTPSNREFDALCAAVWTGEDTLLVRPYVTDHYFGNARMFFTFRGDTISIHMEKTAEWFMDEYQGDAIGKLKQ